MSAQQMCWCGSSFYPLYTFLYKDSKRVKQYLVQYLNLKLLFGPQRIISIFSSTKRTAPIMLPVVSVGLQGLIWYNDHLCA